MDSLKFLGYTLARIGLLIACTAFSVLVGDIIWPAAASLLPDGGARDVLMGENLRSAVSMIVILLILIPLFWDDGKKHAAYEIWSSVNITLTLIFMVMVCFVPAIFRDSFERDGEASAFYKFAYFPYVWLKEKVGLDFVLSVLIGLALIAGVLFGAYLLSFKRYARMHPVILGKGRHGTAPASVEEDEN